MGSFIVYDRSLNIIMFISVETDESTIPLMILYAIYYGLKLAQTCTLNTFVTFVYAGRRVEAIQYTILKIRKSLFQCYFYHQVNCRNNNSIKFFGT